MNRYGWFVAVCVAALAAANCGGGADCEEWTGTWRGSFTGTVEGNSFDLSSSDFTLVFSELSDEMARMVNATWVLAGGYFVEFKNAELTCEDISHTFSDDNVICFIEHTSGNGDNCDFLGTVSRESGSGSGTWRAPAAADRSPTHMGSGSWTLNKD